MTDKKLTDNEIVKALELEVNKKSCIHEQYEEACGLWCKHYHKWCEDMSGKNKKNNCSAFKPTAPTKKAKGTLDLINRLQAEKEALINGQETLQKYIADLQARIGIYETCNARKDEAIKHLEGKVKRLQAENERLKSKLEPQGFEEADPMDFCGVLCDFAEGLIAKATAEAYKKIADMIDKITWYHINKNGELVQGANSETDIPLYKAKDIHNLLKEMVGSNDKL